jgi:hypothetical protein
MASFTPIQNEFLTITSTFNENVNDAFGSSINGSILEPFSEVLNHISIVEENDKSIQMLQIEQLLLEARSIFP